ncbi:hypothetical protein PVK06_022976 [Gossypium arboreum]|uniref:Uncharacterized protein n=1 Tax=Gossypium arboreum TaxID=29729 RepID=A0ABR0PA14_GOSAR|nr:hypothetical protein PVK06_022976 [Gossypium arboreum]
MHAHLVKTPLVTVVVDSDSRDVHGGWSTIGLRGRGFQPQTQCQICSQFDHLAQHCFYHFNRDYGGPNASTTVRFSFAADGQGDDLSGRIGFFDGSRSGGNSWRGWPHSQKGRTSLWYPDSEATHHVCQMCLG